ncbi:MAG: SRPBCC family protein [Candidatus Eisenbacteria bacterium]|uniref:SRPBCC family protein n=1 Tax=Eiseniibacteriota bacterium TaxID=2212470 RepID=A0A956LXX9_UNCEI|nr:SRPBCC family protein [Candidatus Eisenbacteria bacterium]
MEMRSDREIVISRTFRAPARILFDAWTRADLVSRWWAPKSHGVEIAHCEADVRVGGKYRYVLRKGDDEFAFSGTYSEVTPPTRLVYSHVFEAFPDSPVTVTVTFEELDGETRLVAHEVYPSKEALAGALSSGMEHGMRETMDQLDALVAVLL